MTKKKNSLEKCESTSVSSENELTFSCCRLNGLAMLHYYLLLFKSQFWFTVVDSNNV